MDFSEAVKKAVELASELRTTFTARFAEITEDENASSKEEFSEWLKEASETELKDIYNNSSEPSNKRLAAEELRRRGLTDTVNVYLDKDN